MTARPAPAPRSPNVDRLRAALRAYLQRRGLRSTEQRRLIVETLFESTDHVTVDELHERVRAVNDKVGKATIYRTVKMLTDGGILRERRFGDGSTRYELSDDESHHDHLICVDCGGIAEFEEPLIEQLQDRVAERYRFEVLHHKHELYGVCERCQLKRARSRPPRST